MLTQLTLALRILRRRTFFTFISLFGIGFTIMALVVVAAMGEAGLGDNPPLSDRDRLVYASGFASLAVVPDTSYIVDSAVVDGVTTYDSTLQVGEEQQADRTSGVGYYLFDRYLREVDGAERVTYASPSASFDAYLDGRKVMLSANYTDAAYWEVFDYEFVAGAPYTREDVAAGAPRIVVSDAAARDYFGEASERLVGEPLIIGDDRFVIAGIVAQPAQGLKGLASDVFLPYTRAKGVFFDVDYHGGGLVVFRTPTSGGRERVTSALAEIAKSLPSLPADPDKNRFRLEGLTYAEEYANFYYGTEYERAESFARFFGPVAVLLLMFVLLPALNLANVNVSRVYERAAEIGVRKSFGATDRDILRQFLVETLVVTLIGGVIGVALALGVLYAIDHFRWIDGFRPRFTPEVAAWAVVLTLVFGLLSGLLPALRMAQTRIATSLR